MEPGGIATNLYYIRARSLGRISSRKPRRDRSWIRTHVQSLWWVDRDLWHGVRYRLYHQQELPSESISPFCCRTLKICTKTHIENEEFNYAIKLTCRHNQAYLLQHIALLVRNVTKLRSCFYQTRLLIQCIISVFLSLQRNIK